MTTAAPTTARPATTAAPPPAETPDASDVEDFIRDYYDRVANSDYKAGYASLAPEFKAGQAGSYDDYVSYWEANDAKLRGVDVRDVGADGAVVWVNLRYETPTGRVDEVDELRLRRGDAGQFLIAEQRVVG